MKMFKILLCMLFVFANIAEAKVYLMVDKQTKEIKSLSNEDDAQLQLGWEKVILPIDIDELELLEKPRYYKYKNKKFILNVKKISDEELAIIEKAEKQAELDLIMKRAKKKAKDELEAEGVKFRYDHDTE